MPDGGPEGAPTMAWSDGDGCKGIIRLACRASKLVDGCFVFDHLGISREGRGKRAIESFMRP